jgi:hypothetical protein
MTRAETRARTMRSWRFLVNLASSSMTRRARHNHRAITRVFDYHTEFFMGRRGGVTRRTFDIKFEFKKKLDISANLSKVFDHCIVTEW